MRDGHLSTGLIGTKDLMLALAKIGRNPDTGLGAGDVAYRLIHNDTFPSWWLSLHQTRRHQHLGALERLDARDRLRRPRHTKRENKGKKILGQEHSRIVLHSNIHARQTHFPCSFPPLPFRVFRGFHFGFSPPNTLNMLKTSILRRSPFASFRVFSGKPFAGLRMNSFAHYSFGAKRQVKPGEDVL